jgi:adenine-specific DNA-methyltransferase
MQKLDLQTPDFTSQNIARLAELFPNCVTEKKNPDGTLRRAIDFDLLSQELSHDLVEGSQERYRLDWPGKRAALALANEPIRKTLRPARDVSEDFESTRNLFIEGDNLDALKLLQETYLGQVKMIYIDPPYNTGNDFIYDDDFSISRSDYQESSGDVDEQGRAMFDEEKWKQNSSSNGRFHSEWLSMMYPRLKLARNLLKEDGVIFISIDDNEVDSLRKMCNEVFGDQNFVAQIIWQKVYAPKNTADWFSEDHDYILVYARNKSEWRPQKLARTEEMEARYKNPDNDPRGPWKAADMSARNRYDAGVYPVTSPSGRIISGPPTGRYWVTDEKKFKSLDSDNRIWWGNDGNNTPAVKKFLSEVSGGRTPQTLWFYKEVGHTQDAKKTLLKYVPFQHTENVLNSVKPVELLQRMLQLAGRPSDNDIVLDFFSGSASTAHAVLKQNFEDGGNRRFIGVQIPEALPKPEPGLASIFEMGLTRVRNYADELRSEPDSENIDLGFRVLKIDSSNMADVYYQPDELTQDTLALHVDNLKPGRLPEDLLFQVLLDWGVDFALPITEKKILKHRVFFVDDNALAACFDPGLDETFVKELAKRQPLRAVFRDSGYASDAVKINFEQIFRALSPHTELKTL